MGCILCSIGSFVSVILDALERISLWTVCAMLICCLTITIIALLLIGIGIGYHYCFIGKISNNTEPNRTQNALPSNFLIRSVNTIFQENIHQIARREVTGFGFTKKPFNITMTRVPTVNVTQLNNFVL